MSKLLPYELTGKKSSDQLIVFLHGWPDTAAIWDRIVPTVEQDYYVLNISYPNYTPKEKNPKGNDLEEMADRIKATIDAVNDTKRKLLFVGHDTGALYSYYLDQRYPKYIDELIALDVGGKFPFWHHFVMFYQFILVLGFVIGGTIGNWLTHYIVNYSKYRPSWVNKIESSWNYHYFYLWKKIVKAGFSPSKGILPGYQPSCNIAFVHTTYMKFFTDEWIDLLKKDPKNEVHELKCSHWIQTDEPDFLINLIRRKIGALQKK